MQQHNLCLDICLFIYCKINIIPGNFTWNYTVKHVKTSIIVLSCIIKCISSKTLHICYDFFSSIMKELIDD